MNKEIIIALCAGEASGDLLGAHLIEALKQQYDHIRFVGIGGPRMKAAGLISLAEQEPLAVRGYVEVLGHLPSILKIRKHLLLQLKGISPHVFVGIDAPNFNLPIAEKLKAVGIPTLHYVSPSVWAWKPERVHKIVRQVNKVLCLFPMEPQLYRDAGGQAEYVGHPLAQMLPMENSREAVRERLKLGLTTPVFTLLPGSRLSEVDFMTPIFLRAAALIVRDLPESIFLMPYPSAGVRERLQHFLKQEEFRALPIRLQAAKTELACMAADVVLVTSGTASLEVALCKRPMVISYKISPFTYSLVRRKIKIPYVGLPNILLNKMVVPELLQHNATPEKLAAAVLDWYYHPARVNELEQQFVQLHQRLKRNTDELAAYQVLSEAGVRLPKPIAEGEDEQQPEPPPPNDPEPEPENPPAQPVHQAENPETPEPLLIPPPSIVMGSIPTPADNQVVSENKAEEKTDNPISETASTPVVSAPMQPENTGNTIDVPHTNAEEHTTQHHNEFDMSKAKRKSGLFGWLSSLFGGNKPVIIEEQAPQYERVGDEYDSNASIVAVSRAENSDVAKSDATTDTASPNQPNQSTTEPRTAPAPINLPKSGVLAQQNSKPNIFTKYMENGDNAAQAESVQDNVNENAKAEPSIQVQTHNQPALKVKITAVVRQPEERAAPQIMQPETPAETETVNKEETATPVIEPAATVIQTQASTPVTPLQPPVGALANYINQASMAWLPESMKHPATSSPAVSSAPTAPAVPAETQPTVVENAVVKTDDDAVDVTELVSNVEPIVLPNTTVPEVELPVAEEILAKQQAEQAAATQQQNDAPRIQVNMPKITVQVAPKKAPDAEAKTPVAIEASIVSKQTIAEHKAPQITVQATPAAPKQAAAPIVPTPVAEPVLVATQPETPAAPAPASNAHNSFASVFRRHTLQTEQANHADEAHNVAEPVETEEPAQIVLNRSESLTQAPTQAAQAEAPSEEGLTAPSVSNYSSNPNRYNQGIFF